MNDNSADVPKVMPMRSKRSTAAKPHTFCCTKLEFIRDSPWVTTRQMMTVSRRIPYTTASNEPTTAVITSAASVVGSVRP